MENDLHQFGRDLTERLEWLLTELSRLKSENERLLRENKDLREEVTLTRLRAEFGGDAALSAGISAPELDDHALSREALTFYRDLPETIDFTDFFRRAEGYGMSGAKAREYMLSFFRSGLLAQRGRRLEKSTMEQQPGRLAQNA